MHESNGKQFPKWDPNFGEILALITNIIQIRVDWSSKGLSEKGNTYTVHSSMLYNTNYPFTSSKACLALATDFRARLSDRS